MNYNDGFGIFGASLSFKGVMFLVTYFLTCLGR